MGEEEVYRAIFEADVDDLISGSKRAQAALVKFQKTVDRVSKQMVRWGTVATVAIGGVIAQSLRAAASVEEMSSRFRVTFKDMSDRVERWASDYAAQIGRSRFAMMAMASDFKVLLTAFGLQDEEAVSAAISLSKLTSDWESFLDIPAAEVVAKVSSGLAGEAEALRRVGVLVNETAIRQDALNAGLIKGTEEIDNLTKVKLRLTRILGGLEEAQGDAIRTSQSLTNQWRFLRGAVQELNVDLGRVFVEDAKSLVGILAELARDTSRWIRRNEGLTRSIGKSSLAVAASVLGLGILGKSILALTAGIKGLAVALGIGTAALTGVVGGGIAAAVAINKFAKVTGLMDMTANRFAQTLITLDLVLGRIRLMTDEQTAALAAFREGHKDAWEANQRLQDQLESGEITAEQYRAAVVRLDNSQADAAQSAKALGKAVEISVEQASKAAGELGTQLGKLESKLQNLIAFQAELDAAQAGVAESAEEVAHELAKVTMAEPERALADYERLLGQIDALWPEIAAGSAEAVSELSSLIGRIPALDLEGLAAAWGISIETARDRLAEMSKDAAETAASLTEMHRDLTNKLIASTMKQVETVGDAVAEIATQLINLRMDIDISPATRKLAEVGQRMAEILGGALTGPGMGTPGLDRLSTARIRPQPGRSSSNIVNISAPVSIEHAEPPAAMGKIVAGELTRLARRGQVKAL